MKKRSIVIAIVAIGVIAWLYAELPKDRNESISVDSHSNNELVMVKPSETHNLESAENKGLVKSDISTCEQLNKACPDCQRNFKEIIEYADEFGKEVAGIGVYSSMPLPSLISFADSGDEKAMFYLGSNLVYLETHGYRFYKNRDLYGAMPKPKQLKNHQVNLQKVKKGHEYLYNAAIKGHPMAWNELTVTKKYLAIKLISKEPENGGVIEQYFAEYMAGTMLSAHLYKNNRLTVADISIPKNYIISLLQKWKPELGTLAIENIYERLLAQSNKIYEEIYRQWLTDKAFEGKEPFTQYMSKELEDYVFLHRELCSGGLFDG